MKSLVKSMTLLGLCLSASLASAMTPEEIYSGLEKAQNRIIQILNEQEPLENRLQQQRQAIRTQQNALAPLMEKVAAARAERDQAAAEARANPSAEATTKQQNAEFRLAIAEREYNQAHSAVQQLETALRADEERQQNNQRNLEKSLADIKALQPALNQQIQAARQQNQQQRSAQQSANSEIQTLRQRLQQAESDNATLKTRLQQLEGELQQTRLKAAATTAPAASSATPPTTRISEPPQASPSSAVSGAASAATESAASSAPQALWEALQQRLRQRNLQEAITPSGRNLYLQHETDRRARALPWLVVDRETYSLETPVSAGSIEVVYQNQRQTITVPAQDDGATYVFILNRVNSNQPELQYFNRAAVQ